MRIIYAYKGYDEQGSPVAGIIEAKDKAEALRTIRGAAKVTSCKIDGIQFGKGSLKKNKLTLLFTQLAYLLDAGIPLHKALGTLASSGDKEIKTTSDKLFLDIKVGLSFATAFRNLGGALAERFYPQLNAGERGADLTKTLRQLGAQLKKEDSTSRAIRTAMMYPVGLLVMTAGVSAFLVTNIVPQIAEVLNEMGAELPLITRFLMGLADFMMSFGGLIVLGIAGLTFAFMRFIKGAGKLWWDTLLLKIPLIGQINLNGELINFYRSLYYLIDAGLPFVPALEFSYSTVTNKKLRMDLEAATFRIKQEGIDLGAAMSTLPYIDPLQLQAIKVGIEANKLHQTLFDTSENLEETNAELIDRIKRMLEPIMMIVIGSICMFIMLAMYMPMFTVIGENM